jgi:hypothetical protein
MNRYFQVFNNLPQAKYEDARARAMALDCMNKENGKVVVWSIAPDMESGSPEPEILLSNDSLRRLCRSRWSRSHRLSRVRES